MVKIQVLTDNCKQNFFTSYAVGKASQKPLLYVMMSHKLFHLQINKNMGHFYTLWSKPPHKLTLN